MKIIAFILAFFASFAAHAEWVYLAKSSDNKTNYYIKKGTFDLTTNGGQVIMKFDNTGHSFFYVVQISNESCDKGWGEINLYHTNKVHAQTYSYVQGGGTIIQNVAEGICQYIAGSKGENL